MGAVHRKVWQQLDKYNKNSKVKKFVYCFFKQLTIGSQVKYPKDLQLPTLL